MASSRHNPGDSSEDHRTQESVSEEAKPEAAIAKQKRKIPRINSVAFHDIRDRFIAEFERTAPERAERIEKLIERMNRKIPVPPNMQKIVGELEATSQEIELRILTYARKSLTGYMVECDEVLSEALGGGTTSIVFGHIPRVIAAQLPEDGPRKYALSQEFQSFLGTGETELDKKAAFIRVWEYIRDNDLRDSVRMVKCDAKLAKLFKCDSTLINHLTERVQQHLLGCRYVWKPGCNWKRLNLPPLQS